MAKQSRFKLAEKTCDTLKEVSRVDPSKRLTALEVAKRIVKNPNYEKDCQNKLKHSRHPALKDKNLVDAKNDFINQVSREIQANIFKYIKKNPKIKINNKVRPRVFFYSEKVDEENREIHDLRKPEEETPDIEKIAERNLEKDLHTPLQSFLYYTSSYKVYSRFIQHAGNQGQKSGKNRWLFPDLVGLQDCGEDWESYVKNCVAKGNYNRIKFWSFEVKREITESNVRESFFETVSNSSWANFAYLAAPEIQEQDKEAEKELRLLCNTHGIGFIVIDKENFSEGSIKISAIEKEADWNAINRLAKDSKEFREKYVDVVRDFYHNQENRKFSLDDWEIEILEDD